MFGRRERQLISEALDAQDARREAAREALQAHPDALAVAEAHDQVRAMLAVAAPKPMARSIARDVIRELEREPASRHAHHPALFWTGAGAVCVAVALTMGLLLRSSGGVPTGGGTMLRPARHIAAVSDERPATPLTASLCAREHARLASGTATTDRATWAVALVEGNREILR